MELIFSKHAMEKIAETKVSLSQIAECYTCPDKIKEKDDDTVAYFKLIDSNKKLLILVCNKDKPRCKIITIILTSQINRYLNK